MTKSRQIEESLRSLNEIKDVMTAMKNLSFLEIRKLSRFLSTQHRVFKSIETMVGDFLTFFPSLLEALPPMQKIYLLIGSERGFCGDFNEILWSTFERDAWDQTGVSPRVLIVGRKLNAKVAKDPRVAAFFEGPNSVEEVQPVLSKIMDWLKTFQSQQEQFFPLCLTVVYHLVDQKGLEISIFEPFEKLGDEAIPFPFPPQLHQPPEDFLLELIDHYLFAALHEVFYNSLMAENHRRYQHMENAIQRLDRKLVELSQKRNLLRQEEITNEIEIIMLSLEALMEVRDKDFDGQAN
ncbi:MAG TPA: FoF1 ATP synthase subunit gamma [Nitrospiria bacterium]|jgi:F-type H+-transporting ATPase subunit gamma